MSTRTPPVRVIGDVHVLAPTASMVYFRLPWTAADGTARRTSAGRILDAAIVKATEVADTLSRSTAPGGLTLIADVVAARVSTPVGRNQRDGKDDWSPTHLDRVTARLARRLRGVPGLRAGDLDSRSLRAMVKRAGTPRGVKENVSAWRGLLSSGLSEGYLTEEQAVLLPRGARRRDPGWVGTKAPTRGERASVRRNGDDTLYIADEDAPDAARRLALALELDLEFPLWGHSRWRSRPAAGCGGESRSSSPLTTCSNWATGCSRCAWTGRSPRPLGCAQATGTGAPRERRRGSAQQGRQPRDRPARPRARGDGRRQRRRDPH
jgi:hypothetical protein